ncbi:MAG: hypothetical protein U0796_19715 [Gemmatales bacterium]
MNYLRFLPVLVALAIMIAIACTPQYEKVTISIPTGLAAGFMLTRWYCDLPPSIVRRKWKQLAGNVRLAYLIPLGLTLLLSIIPSLVRGRFPPVSSHDEFSYILAADTYLHGRLANPTPAGWQHFESMHINVIPAYCSKYQPGMGLMLAAGQLLGHPYFGMLMALGIASLASTWMFRSWLPPVWALKASLLMTCPLATNWGDYYFAGGPLAIIAGAILVRYFKTVRRHKLSHGDAMLLSGCLVLLFWTRPFEGGIAALLLGIPILYFAFCRQGLQLFQMIPACILILAPAAWFQFSLNQACTGSYTKLPYIEHEEQYGMTPLFLFQPPRAVTPEYRNATLQSFHKSMLSWYELQHDHRLSRALLFKAGTGWNFFFSLFWLVPLCMLPELCRMPLIRYLLACWFLLFLILLFGTTWFLNHYAAPLAPAWAIVIIFACRLVSQLRYRGYAWGRFIIVLLFMSFSVQAVVERNLVSYFSKDATAAIRSTIERQLSSEPGRHLIFMTYGSKHDTGQECVYNSATISAQKVIWARSLGREADELLMKEYPQRQYWILHADSTQDPPVGKLEPYPITPARR